jgi:hypothetical protein
MRRKFAVLGLVSELAAGQAPPNPFTAGTVFTLVRTSAAPGAVPIQT